MKVSLKMFFFLAAATASTSAWAYPPCSFDGFEGVVGGIDVQSSSADQASIILYGVGGVKTTSPADSSSPCSDGYSGIGIFFGKINSPFKQSLFDQCLKLANNAAADYRVGQQTGMALKDIARLKISVRSPNTANEAISCRLVYSGEAGSSYAQSDWKALSDRLYSQGARN